MSNLPAFAQGAKFSIDTTGEVDDVVPSFHPHAPHPPQGRRFSDHQPPRGPRYPPRSDAFTPRGHFNSGVRHFHGNFTPRPHNFTGGHNPQHHFYDRPSWSEHQGHMARGPQGRPGGQRGPSYSNPYERQLTPRQHFAPRQRWTHTLRGTAQVQGSFGPCAKGASQDTLAQIDAFVKPSMCEDPWTHLESHAGGSEVKVRAPSPKRIRADVDPDQSPPPDEDDADEGATTSGAGGGMGAGGEAGAGGRVVEEDDDDFNIKDFIPKV